MIHDVPRIEDDSDPESGNHKRTVIRTDIICRFIWANGTVRSQGKCITVSSDTTFILADCAVGKTEQSFTYDKSNYHVRSKQTYGSGDVPTTKTPLPNPAGPKCEGAHDSGVVRSWTDTVVVSLLVIFFPLRRVFYLTRLLQH